MCIRDRGKTVRVLVDKIENGSASGNSDEMKLVRFPVKEGVQKGSLVQVKVLMAMEWQLLGEVVTV